MRRYLPWGLLVPGVILLAGFAAYQTMSTGFSRWDDEGYLLLSLSEFVHGRPLYDEVYSQYGPFYYLLFGALFKVTGQTVTTDAGRLLVTAIWVAITATYGLAAWRISRNWILSLGAAAVAFTILSFFVTEPMHPVSLVSLLIAAIAAATAGAPTHPKRALIIVGVLVACLLLTKINAGALTAIAIVGTCGLTLPGLVDRRWVRIGSIVLMLLIPFLLLVPDRELDWVQRLLLIELATVGAAIVIIRATPLDEVDDDQQAWSTLRIALASAVAAGVVVLALTLALGTSPAALLDGTVLEPLSLRKVYGIPFPSAEAAVGWSVASLGAAYAFAALPAGGTERIPDAARGTIRIVAGAVFWFTLSGIQSMSVQTGTGRLILPMVLAWVALRPPAGATELPWTAWRRRALVLVPLFYVLTAYPVAGSQQMAAALPFIPVGALLIHDGVLQVRGALGPDPEWARWGRQATTAACGILAAWLLLTGPVRSTLTAEHTRDENVALTAYGAQRLRLPGPESKEFSRLAGTLRDHCDTFVSDPGFGTFYLWSNLRPPGGMNPGDWLLLLNEKQQQQTVDAARKVKRLCLVQSPQWRAAWVSGDTHVPNFPLRRFIDETPWTSKAKFFDGQYEIFTRAVAPTPPPVPPRAPAKAKAS